MSQRKGECCVCHLIIASADPERVTHGDLVAHAGCLANSLPEVRGAVDGFLKARSTSFIAGYFRRESADVRSREKLAAIVKVVLSMTLNSPGGEHDAELRRNIVAFADRMSAKLLVDIVLQ